jgi:adenylate cyclase
MRVERCFAFIDLSGFTAFTERFGDERTVSVLSGFRGRVREIAARRGVRVTKWLGDGAMLSSADGSAVVAMVIELAYRVPDSMPLSLRAGLANGAVIMFEGDDYIGRPANVAARLCDTACPGQILATREVASLAPRWVYAAPVTPYQIHGLERAVEASALSLATGDETTVDPCCGLTLPVQRGLDTRFGPDQTIFRFCSTACAVAWEETQRARLAALEVP